MKRLVYIFIVFCMFFLVETDLVKAIPQDTIQDPTEEELTVQDSVSIDDMDPVFYTALEDEELEPEKSGNASWIIYVVIGVIVVGGGFFFFLRSKRK
ncbi:MAG: LPXTG cell wall anchor domain-containing protein [Bacteroidetes bacterium]|nr:LPXTG cell wall anchor domain-containing protein [Bacteroidota bacterium]